MNIKTAGWLGLLLVPALALGEPGEGRGRPMDDDEGAEMHERRGRPDMDDDGDRGGREGRHRKGGMDSEMREQMEKARALQKKIREKARALREAGKDKAEGLKKEIEKDLGELFDMKLAATERMLKKMEERSAEMRKKIEKRRARKAELVKKRLAQMTGDDDDLDW